MKLRETYIEMTGFFKCSIENNIIICDGMCMSPKNPDADIADMYVWNVFDQTTNLISAGVLVVFKQVDDKIQFLYKKLKFDVVSITDKLITVNNDGVDYYIERIDSPLIA